MRRPTACLLPALLLASACAVRSSGPTGAPSPPAGPARAARVVLVSMDGLAALHQRAMVRSGAYHDPDGLGAFTANGFVVDEAVPVDPTLTAASHASIATGAFPAATGIVSNAFHLPGTPLTHTVSGFDVPWQSEALWQAFRRQGKRVGVLLFPGCDAVSPARTADFGMTYPTRSMSRPRTERLAATAFAPSTATLPAGTPSYSPLRAATLRVTLRGEDLPAEVAFHVTALDTSDDGAVDYDALAVEEDAGSDATAVVHADEWFPLRLITPASDGGRRTVGAWCLVRRLPVDLDGVEIYVGSFNATFAYPRAFRERLDAEAGFWPGPADDHAVGRALAGEPGLSPQEYLAQVRRFSEYLTACFRVAVTSERFDLLMAYQPIVDEVQHAFTVTDQRQTDYSPGLAATAAGIVDTTYGIADRAIGAMARSLDLRRDALVVVSDHGIAPVWESVYVNEVLHAAGLLDVTKGPRSEQVAPTSRIAAVTSGGCAHLYVNLVGREQGGVVPASERAEVVRRAARALALVEVDGTPAVEAMYTRAQAAPLGARQFSP
jgi:predicted AlkP superfamily pyrophosphatase or phosphodiesterase